MWRSALLLCALCGCGQLGLQAVDATVDGKLAVEPVGVSEFGQFAPADGQTVDFKVGADESADGPVEVDEVWLEGDTGVFTIVGVPNVPHRLDPGRRVGVRVRFAPTESGSFSAELIAKSSTGQELRRRLHGRGCTDRDHDRRCD